MTSDYHVGDFKLFSSSDMSWTPFPTGQQIIGQILLDLPWTFPYVGQYELIVVLNFPSSSTNAFFLICSFTLWMSYLSQKPWNHFLFLEPFFILFLETPYWNSLQVLFTLAKYLSDTPVYPAASPILFSPIRMLLAFGGVNGRIVFPHTICWSCRPQYLKTWSYLETGSLQM